MGHIQKIYEISHSDDGDGDVVKIYSYNIDKVQGRIWEIVVSGMIRFVFLSVWLVSFYCLYIGCLFDQLSVWLVGLLLPRRSSRENICAGEWPAVQAKFIADIPLARRTTTIPHHQIPKYTASPPWRIF